MWSGAEGSMGGGGGGGRRGVKLKVYNFRGFHSQEENYTWDLSVGEKMWKISLNIYNPLRPFPISFSSCHVSTVLKEGEIQGATERIEGDCGLRHFYFNDWGSPNAIVGLLLLNIVPYEKYHFKPGNLGLHDNTGLIRVIMTIDENSKFSSLIDRSKWGMQCLEDIVEIGNGGRCCHQVWIFSVGLNLC